MVRTPQAQSTTSIVRLALLPAHKDKLETSEEWYATADKIKQEPNIGYVTKGQSLDDELDIVLFISWDYAAKPSASFLSGNIDHIFSPLRDFLAKKPRLMCSICNVNRLQGVRSFTTDESFKSMGEIMTVRGPADAIESVMKEMKIEINAYLDAQDVGMDFYDIHFSEQAFLGGGLYRVRREYARDDIDSEEHSDWASFVLHLSWFSPERRAEFQDPTIPDRAIPHVFQEFYGGDWWQQKVMKPLEEVGATISSWTYHKGQIARGRKERLVISKFEHWLSCGYMDDDSLAQFERQLVEKDQQSD